MDRIIKHNRIITSILGVLLAFSSIILSVSDTYAVSYGSAALYNIQSAGAFNGNSYYTCTITNGAASCISQNSSNGVISSMSIVPANTIPANSLISFDITIRNHGGALEYYGFAPVRGYFYKVSEDFEYNNTNMMVSSHVVLYTYQAVSEFGIDTMLATVYGNSDIELSKLSVVVLQGQVDNTSQLNSIAYETGLINTNLTNIRGDIQNVQDSVDDLGQTQQDIYDDEKDTINQNGDDASDLWNGTTFSLSFTDPFTTFWNLFTDSKCVDITALANLVNAPQITTVCSPYPDGVKEIFSPCFNLFAVFFAVFFFIRWLSDSHGFTSIPDTSEPTITAVARDDWYDRHGYKR